LTSSARWDEWNLSEEPAIKQLQKLSYKYVDPSELDLERESRANVVLEDRLKIAIQRLNPWIDENNLKKAIRRTATVVAASTIEANERTHRDLVHYFSLEQDRGSGRKGQTVRLIDFDNPDNNEFLVTNQFKVNGPRENIICDIVVFINGIPLVVIECKSPTVPNPIESAITQLARYQDEIFGAPKLFQTNLLLVTTCGQAASCAAIGSEPRHFKAWKDPHPLAIADLEAKLGRKPNPQEVLIAGIFDKRNLLDLLRNFVVFEAVGGRMIKKIARYQQFRAVNRAMDRILTGKTPKKKGGIVWHTQGSGKSLSMLWLAVKLRRERILENPTIVIATDRVDLDRQITGTFKRCGFPNPKQARSIAELKKILSRGPGQTVMTTVQKFQTESDDQPFPLLSESENIFVMVDEAHRTQYKSLAANMRTALPNATYLGFTGTPIDKKDRSTKRTFGSYIDTYTIEQSVQDGMTVPIYYESRLPELRVEGEDLDELFERVFKDYSEKETAKIKRKYVTEQAIASAPRRIEKICLDLLKHYEEHIAPDGLKAQIVTVNRRTAAVYKEVLDRLNGPESAVIMSSAHNDPPELRKYRRTKAEQSQLVDRFLKPMDEDQLSFLIVCDMLLTGFDAPVEQVMYLDKPLREHTLLQAIARVNRTYEGKKHGLIVDYYGISQNLEDALAIFEKKDITGALTPLTTELPRLEQRHRVVMRFFDKVDRSDLEACISAIEPLDTRTEFDQAFRKFSESMNMIMPDPAANPYRKDLKFLGKVRDAARIRFRDEELNLAGCGAKVRRLIEEHILADGVKQIITPISILDDRFHEHVTQLKSDEAKASEMEHAIRHHITVKLNENPAFYESLRERLEAIIEQRKVERLLVAEMIRQLREIIVDIQTVEHRAQSLGLTEDQFAFHESIRQKLPELAGSDAKTLTIKIVEEVEKLAVIDWTMKSDIQRRMRRKVKSILRAASCPQEQIEPLTLDLLDLARVRMKN
jgi:type I restriction enzyme R subunit